MTRKLKKWTDAFTPTNAGPEVWHSAAGLLPLNDLAHNRDGQAFGDGGWWSESPGASGMGGSVFPPNYTNRVVGWGVMRFLCHRYGLISPNRRLKGEPFKPDLEVLAELILEQMASTQPTRRQRCLC